MSFSSYKIEGQKGLPFGSAGKVISLISDGIDSPVATYLMMKRGAEPIFLNFEQNKKATEKVKKIVKILEKYSPEKLELKIIDHKKLINPIIENLIKLKKQKWMCIFCKRLMLKKAQELAKQKNALGIITGEQLAQVASQTLPNQLIIKHGFEIPIYEPLIGLDKQDGIDIAKKIGTYEISSEKAPGCIFLPEKVETGAKFEEFLKIKNEIEK